MCTLVQWKPSSCSPAPGQEEAGRVEPRLGDPLVEVGAGHRALLGVVGEGVGVDRQERVLVAAHPERPYVDPVGRSAEVGAGGQGRGASPTGRAPGRGRDRAARAAAAGWLPCDQAVSRPGAGRPPPRAPHRDPCRAPPGVTTRSSASSCSQAKPSAGPGGPGPSGTASQSADPSSPGAAARAGPPRRAAPPRPRRWPPRRCAYVLGGGRGPRRHRRSRIGATRITVLAGGHGTTLGSTGREGPVMQVLLILVGRGARHRCSVWRCCCGSRTSRTRCPPTSHRARRRPEPAPILAIPLRAPRRAAGAGERPGQRPRRSRAGAGPDARRRAGRAAQAFSRSATDSLGGSTNR